MAKESDEEDDKDHYYENTDNNRIKVEYITFQGYILPPLHVIF